MYHLDDYLCTTHTHTQKKTLQTKGLFFMNGLTFSEFSLAIVSHSIHTKTIILYIKSTCDEHG